jgi:glutaredoxin 2
MQIRPLVEDLNARLIELDDVLYSEHHYLRSITIVSGVQWPSKLRSYMDNLSALGDVPLYDEMAL